MKKLILLTILLFIPINVYAEDKVKVKYISCIDGDTVNLLMNNKEIKVRMLAIDTPELNNKENIEEPYAIEAKNYTCNKLKKANKIELEFDKNSKKKDKYGRYLAWVFYDNNLIQNDLVKKGYADIKYLYDDYKYTDILKKSKEDAIKNERGIFSKVDNSKYTKSKNKEEKIKKIFKKYLKKINSNINKLFNDILEEIF